MRSERVRLADIAAACGVSTSTVSYVLGGKARERGLSEDTVEKINKTARDLGYVRNQSARALRRGKTNTLVFFYDPPMDRFVERYILRAAKRLRANGYQIVAVPVAVDEVEVVAQTLGSGVCDAGILGIGRNTLDRLLETFTNPPVPTLILAAQKDDPGTYDRVFYDEEDAIRQVLQALVDSGRERIVMAAQEETLDEVSSALRWQVYESFQRERGAQPELLFYGASDVTRAFNSAMSALKAGATTTPQADAPLLDDRQDTSARIPDAIYCNSDRCAMGIIMAAEQLHIRVPDTLSVIGTGNSSDAQAFPMPVTSVGLSDESIDTILSALIARLSDPTLPVLAITERWQTFVRATTPNIR